MIGRPPLAGREMQRGAAWGGRLSLGVPGSLVGGCVVDLGRAVDSGRQGRELEGHVAERASHGDPEIRVLVLGAIGVCVSVGWVACPGGGQARHA